jgi:hypothetical protein
MPAGKTYDPIATTTLSSNQATVTFSSISSGYTDLVLVGNAGTDVLDRCFWRVNSDTASNYSRTTLFGDGSGTSTDRESNQTQSTFYDGFGTATTLASSFIMYFNNYSNQTTFKTVIIRASTASSGTGLSVGMWRSTDAITNISLAVGSSRNWLSGSTFTLYGIAAA